MPVITAAYPDFARYYLDAREGEPDPHLALITPGGTS